jgi:hypothetical protein
VLLNLGAVDIGTAVIVAHGHGQVDVMTRDVLTEALVLETLIASLRRCTLRPRINSSCKVWPVPYGGLKCRICAPV